MKKIVLLFCLLSGLSCIAQVDKPPGSITFDLGTNAYVFDNEYGFFMGLGYEYHWLRPFSTEIRFQTGRSVDEQFEPINEQQWSDNYILETQVDYFSFGVFPRYYQELSDIIFLFVDAGLGVESSRSSATFINESEMTNEALESASTPFKFYPGFHIGLKIVGEGISGSFYLGYERLQLDRSINKLDIEQTGIFSNYSKSTNFPQFGIKLSVPLKKKQWRYNPDTML